MGFRIISDETFDAFVELIDTDGDITAYAELTKSTALYPGAGTGSPQSLAYAALGLSNEAGEVAGKVKKLLRGDDGVVELTNERRAAIAAELGDVAWYLVMMCAEVGVPITTILIDNVMKLKKRREENTIKGDGDNR